MYKYDQYDQQVVDERVAQFRDQTQRYLAGEISDEQFLPAVAKWPLCATFSTDVENCGSYGLLSVLRSAN